MSSAPILSVLIPFHASEKADRRSMLAELLATIPNRSDIEIIVVDDNSTLDLEKQHLAQRTVTIERLPEGRRYAGSARNHAMELATGRFCLFADSDDLFDDGALDLICDRLATAQDSAHTVYVFDAQEITQGKTSDKLYLDVVSSFDQDAVTRMLLGWHAPWGKIFSREAAMKAGVRGTESQRVANDVMLSCRLAFFAERIVRFSGPAYLVRREHGLGALTARKDKASIRTRIHTFREMNAYIIARQKPHLIVPMHHAFRSFFRDAPLLVIGECIASVLRGEKILPSVKGRT